MLQWHNINLLRAFHEGNNTIFKFTEESYMLPLTILEHFCIVLIQILSSS